MLRRSMLAAAVLVFAAFVGPALAAQAPPADDAAAVRALVERYQAARDKSDAAALAALFVADADQLVSSGEWRRGREAVVTGSLGSSQRTPGRRTLTVETVRMVGPGVALADSRYDIAQADGTVRRMWASWVIVKDGAGWKIAAIRNMLPTTPAAAATPAR